MWASGAPSRGLVTFPSSWEQTGEKGHFCQDCWLLTNWEKIFLERDLTAPRLLKHKGIPTTRGWGHQDTDIPNPARSYNLFRGKRWFSGPEGLKSSTQVIVWPPIPTLAPPTAQFHYFPLLPVPTDPWREKQLATCPPTASDLSLIIEGRVFFFLSNRLGWVPLPPVLWALTSKPFPSFIHVAHFFSAQSLSNHLLPAALVLSPSAIMSCLAWGINSFAELVTLPKTNLNIQRIKKSQFCYVKWTYHEAANSYWMRVTQLDPHS